ncbi:retinoschisin-like [Oculina patagonica]
MESGAILDGKITATSSYNPGRTGPSRGRLNLHQQGSKSGGWVAGIMNSWQWLTVEFHNDGTIITAVATQGRQDYDQWVTKYRLKYSTWPNVDIVFDYIESGQNAPKEFLGNTDRNSVVYHELNPPINSSFKIVFSPREWHNVIAMRVEVYGCKDACLSSPCENNATCVSNYGSGTFTCSCPSGYTAYTCAAVITCPMLPAPSNGTRLGCPGNATMYYDTVCQFSCNNGYIGSGSQVRKCQPNGTWSGQDFTCQSMILTCSTLR